MLSSGLHIRRVFWNLLKTHISLHWCNICNDLPLMFYNYLIFAHSTKNSTMKKIFLSIAVISAITISSKIHAQGVGVGIKAGANFANQSITDISTDSKTGFHGGAYLILAFSEK